MDKLQACNGKPSADSKLVDLRSRSLTSEYQRRKKKEGREGEREGGREEGKKERMPKFATSFFNKINFTGVHKGMIRHLVGRFI